MDDEQIQRAIQELVTEEQRLWDDQARESTPLQMRPGSLR